MSQQAYSFSLFSFRYILTPEILHKKEKKKKSILDDLLRDLN